MFRLLRVVPRHKKQAIFQEGKTMASNHPNSDREHLSLPSQRKLLHWGLLGMRILAMSMLLLGLLMEPAPSQVEVAPVSSLPPTGVFNYGMPPQVGKL